MTKSERGGGSPQTADAQYMAKHHLPTLVERLLGAVVPSRHPRPFEVASLLLLVPTPAAAPPRKPDQKQPLSSRSATSDSLLDSLHFDVFSVDADGPDGVEFVVNLFRRHGLLDTFAVSEERMQNWARSVQQSHRACAPLNAPSAPLSLTDPEGKRRVLDGDDALPLHNFRRTLNTLHTLHVLLTAMDGAAGFDKLEILAMLVAAACCNLQHPGRDAAFLKLTGHPISVRFSDMAPLEQHSASVAFAILDDAAADITSSIRFDPSSGNGILLSSEFLRFREHVVKGILATEGGAHAKHVDALRAAAAEGFDVQQTSHRARLMATLVMAADNSTEVRAFPFSRQWAPMWEEERCRQGDAQRALGLPVPDSHDRERAAMGKEQASYISDVCMPVYEALAAVLPKAEECVRNLRANRDTWNALPG
jgi:hypothetical protein